MQKLKLFIFLIVFTSWWQACSWKEPVKFSKIENVRLGKIDKQFINLTAIAVFDNPNKIKGRLKEIDLVVVMQRDTLARLTQTEKLKIEKESIFKVPINVRLSLKDIQSGVLNNIFSILSKRKTALRFRGEIKLSTSGFSRKVPVDYTVNVRL